MINPHLDKKEITSSSTKENNLGLKPSRSYLRQNSNKDLKLALALIVMSE
jgi:hypothetical protein